MRLAPSLFDKLCPPEQQVGGARSWAHSWNLDEIRSSVAIDLERLLNTRRPAWVNAVDGASTCSTRLLAVRRSILAYGIEDFSSRSLSSGLDRDHICESIRHAIECHETRLRSVRVLFDDATTPQRHRLRFLIHAMLVLRPAVEPVSFDAQFEPAVQRYAVGCRAAGLFQPG